MTAVKWLEVHIDTNHTGLEPVETMLSALGIDGVVIDDETEFEDFRLFLDVCRETGIEPLVVLMPLKGELFDETVYTPTCGPMVRPHEASATSTAWNTSTSPPYEYDPYFLYDMAHFGWTAGCTSTAPSTSSIWARGSRP